MQLGRGVPEQARPVRRCACWARWASRSTPRRGCGTTGTSAASAARSWTPGGRRRRARIMITPLPGVTATKPGSRHPAVPRHRRRRGRRGGQGGPARHGRLPGDQAALALDAAHASGATPSATSSTYLAAVRRRRCTSPATAPSGTRTATSGSWAAWTTCINVAGHRLGTMEVESALVEPPRGGRGRRGRQAARAQGPGHRRLRDAEGAASAEPTSWRQELKRARGRRRSAPSPGPTTSASPTTCPRPAPARSCAGCCATSPRAAALGDTTTLADPNVVAQLRQQYEAQEAG